MNTTDGEITIAAGNTTVVTSPVRSGTYALRFNPTAGYAGNSFIFKGSDTTDGYYARCYIRIATLPSVTHGIFIFYSVSTGRDIGIRLTTTGTLQLYNFEDSAQIGSASSTLSTNTWYCVELKVDSTTSASTSCEARLDGVSFASGTASLSGGQSSLEFGVPEVATTVDYYMDDIVLNDDSGSFQNSWPGEGELIHLRPNAVGDNADWVENAVGDSADAVDEVTPNDGTDYLGSSTLNETTDVNLAATPAALESGDTISCVQVGARFRTNSTAGTVPQFVLRIKASSGGTVEESGTIEISATTNWVTHSTQTPKNYNLTLYDLPGASTTAWTKTDLDAAQIGVKLINNSTGQAQVTTLWLLVDHKPGAAVASGGNDWPIMTTRGNFWGWRY